MKSENRLAAGARRMRIGTVIGMLATVLLIVLAGAAMLLGGIEGVRFSTSGSAPSAETAGALLSGLPFCFGLWRLLAMLRGIEAGEAFTRGTIADLRGFAFWVLVSSVASIVGPPLFELAGGLVGGGDSLSVTLSFESGDFFALLVSALLFFIARLFGEAQRIADDHRQII
ncbi:DUF2975 domain-containing protein [Allosphingosinicella deserti]|uniref:DUF2975 domain-containing protein n=1 Tax=Allosphingosinicella deserti TaxID=2116704 RepID=A0A2P7QVW0_9SPHN|nr:DUF2975 domain-containing protein [Sphingomonas deserti]PSJ42115.1 hypothetical protein C7I55_07720 [Sphingomonas deserti]